MIRTTEMHRVRFLANVGVFLFALLAFSAPSDGAEMRGQFRIEDGSFFNMPGVGGGPFLGGSQGGLLAGVYQADPAPNIPEGDPTGAGSIVDPYSFMFYGFPVFISTNQIDPVDGATEHPLPVVVDNGGVLTGDISGWDVMWNGTHFNQGAPKAMGNNPAPAGAYNSLTGAYTLSWTSLIVGGPFNGFVGEWILAGHFFSGPECDSDGIPDSYDNCPCINNVHQLDYDLDGIGNPCDNDADGDGFSKASDCDDLSSFVHPGAVEICNNGIDENCDGTDTTSCTAIVGLFKIESGSIFAMTGVGAVALTPGGDAGFIATQYQPDPADPTGRTGCTRIVNPANFVFYGEKTYISTNRVDPLDGVTTYAAPQMYDNHDGTVSGNVQGWDVLWSGQHFNQGAPKDNPVGQADNLPPFGTYDVVTGAYHLFWSSLVVGGPFDGFTGEWDLVGHVSDIPPPDNDYDGTPDGNDNCPADFNPDQADMDMDGIGDVCDPDVDGDGYANNADCEPYDPAAHPGAVEICGNIKDDDCDGTINDADLCDLDRDGVLDLADNCPKTANPTQGDCDSDRLGDACDPDADGDGYTLAQGDCNDTCDGKSSHPGAVDIACDGIDQDCNGADAWDGTCHDADNDGVADTFDNCVDFPNPDQKDFDLDGTGDVCDIDDDNDGTADPMDCAPLNWAIHPGATDTPCDGIDQDCDGADALNETCRDVDNDGILDALDNCIDFSNPDQKDFDGDGTGDVCDIDDDNDGAVDLMDCAPFDRTIHPRAYDIPCDGIDQNCDGADVLSGACRDSDSDGVMDAQDNCVDFPNPDQKDFDRDGTGDACDIDDDNDGTPDLMDCAPLNAAIHPRAAEICTNGYDDNCNGLIDGQEPEFCGPCTAGDADRDNVCDHVDNCVGVSNWAQSDLDGDGIGDACDPDADGDGYEPTLDCNDRAGHVYPGAIEICGNGIDEDCNGTDAADCSPIVGAFSVETGSTFTMVGVGGTALVGGTDGGFFTERYQPDPSPTSPTKDFTGSGAVVDPSLFTFNGSSVYVSINAVDPVDGVTAYGPPRMYDNGDGTLSGSMPGWDCLWNGEHFNQGAPKAVSPMAGAPSPTGHYDPVTRAYDVTWHSMIDAGPFNGFVGEWSLVGRVTPDPCGVIGDTDGDRVCNDRDNCVEISNPDQSDCDGDGLGDACDTASNTCARIIGVFNIETGSVFAMVGLSEAPLLGGTDGGFRTERYQPDVLPSTATRDFTGSAAVVDPAVFTFNGSPVYVSINEVDPVDGVTTYPPPRMYESGNGLITGEVRGWDCLWNGDHFNQGSPKGAPLGLADALAPTGHYDRATGAYDLTWRSLIVGGPFNGFLGEWRLVGHVIPESGIGDTDFDQILDDMDNCLQVPNTDQADCDRDGIGDACDMDSSSCKKITGIFNIEAGSKFAMVGLTEVPLLGGTDGGFMTDRYQSDPSPTTAINDFTGNEAVVNPLVFSFNGSSVYVSINQVDPVDSVTTYPPPRMYDSGNGLMTGELRGWDCLWNGDHFNQGSPKSAPMGLVDALAPTGHYDAAGRTYDLTWRSLIVGGPFNGFLGEWTLVGHVTPYPCPPGTDLDYDGICDNVDNCRDIVNPTQADCDRDGVGDLCDPDVDGDLYTVITGDCDDTCSGAKIHPGAPDTPCDGIDQDCDGEDTLDPTCRDLDWDGLLDINDNCPETSNPTQADCDRDGIGDACDHDVDGDGYTVAQGDCNDSCAGAAMHPGAVDIACNRIDENCDGTDALNFTCRDLDRDGVYDANDNCVTTPNSDQADRDGDSIGDACDADADGDGYDKSTDCDDWNAGVNPGALEKCGNSVDENCDGVVDGACAGYGDIRADVKAPKSVDNCSQTLKEVAYKIENKPFGGREPTTQKVTYVLSWAGQVLLTGTEVVEGNQRVTFVYRWDPYRQPMGRGTWELTVMGDGEDPSLANNTRIRTTDVLGSCGDCVDGDGDTYGVGAGCLQPDCNDANPFIHPGAKEICENGIDENCDGRDELCLPPGCTDLDGDGYGLGMDCLGPDCDDSNASVHPGAIDVCENGMDEDCDGVDAWCGPADVLTIKTASYEKKKTTLTLYVTSSANGNAALTARYGGRDYPMVYNTSTVQHELVLAGTTYYSTVEVASSLGGAVSGSVLFR